MIITGVRRRRDMAILKTLGFVRRQVRIAIAWQASTIMGVCVVVAIPVGIALGRWGWRAIAGAFGVVPDAQVPVLALVAGSGITVLVANLIALGGGSACSRVPSAGLVCLIVPMPGAATYEA